MKHKRPISIEPDRFDYSALDKESMSFADRMAWYVVAGAAMFLILALFV